MKLELGDRQYINGKPARVEGLARDDAGNITKVFLHMEGAKLFDGHVAVSDLDKLEQSVLPF